MVSPRGNFEEKTSPRMANPRPYFSFIHFPSHDAELLLSVLELAPLLPQLE